MWVANDIACLLALFSSFKKYILFFNVHDVMMKTVFITS